MRTASQRLLHAFLDSGDSEPVRVLSIGRQRKNIDVLLLLLLQGRTIAVVVEDKISSVEHDDQLIRYREEAEELFIEQPSEIRVVYFKTGTVSERGRISPLCDKIMERDEILDCLDVIPENDASSPSVLTDFVDKLRQRCEQYDEYRAKPVKAWTDEAYCGFFERLQEVLESRGYWTGYGIITTEMEGIGPSGSTMESLLVMALGSS